MRRFLCLLAATVAWQALFCAVSTEGKLTGLFEIGAAQARPPEPQDRIYVFPNSNGYDGQIYRVIARDPLLRVGTWKLVTNPRHWHRRILVPAVAAALGHGSPAAIDFWYVAFVDLCIALGGVAFVSLATGLCRPMLAGALYLILPSVVASTDRMVVDGVLTALAMVAWWCYRERRDGWLWLALACLPLIRETGILVAPGVLLACVLKREFRRAAWVGSTIVPVLAWWAYLALRTPPSLIGTQLGFPLLPYFLRIVNLRQRPLPPWANTAAQVVDALSIACLLLAFALIAKRARRLDPSTALVVPMAAASLFFTGWSLTWDPYDFMRYAGVLVAWTVLRLLAARPIWAVAYLATASFWLLAFRAVAIARAFIRVPL